MLLNQMLTRFFYKLASETNKIEIKIPYHASHKIKVNIKNQIFLFSLWIINKVPSNMFAITQIKIKTIGGKVNTPNIHVQSK